MDLMGALLLGLPGFALCFKANQFLSNQRMPDDDILVVIGLGKSAFAIGMFAIGLLFVVGAFWWLLREKPVTRGPCVGCGRPLRG
jgi:hypothetical protein